MKILRVNFFLSWLYKYLSRGIEIFRDNPLDHFEQTLYDLISVNSLSPADQRTL